jgi:Niemann-Pick C1 protein
VVLVPGILITVGLCCGIAYLEIITDPVELWASPMSRSRIEKDYFDEHFEPFYRTEQIIVTAKGLPNVHYHPSNNENEPEEIFGPIFNKEFMYALLHMQEKIVNEVNIFKNIACILCVRKSYFLTLFNFETIG